MVMNMNMDLVINQYSYDQQLLINTILNY